MARARTSWSGLTLLFLGASAAAQEPSATERLLGGESRWNRARLELLGPVGAGPFAVHVEGSGRCVVRVAKEGGELRFVSLRPREETHALLARALELDVLGGERTPEGDWRLRLTNQIGESQAVEVEAGSALRRSLLELAERVATGEPSWSGAYDPSWEPWTGVQVEALLSAGADGPLFELAGEDEQRLRAGLLDLPEATPVRRPWRGYRGFRFHLSGHPRAVFEVFGGTVMIQQGSAISATFADAHGLEGWLRERAEAAGVEFAGESERE